MPQDKYGPEDLLLDLHLDRLDERVKAWIEAELLRDSELRAKSDRLRKILRPLDCLTVAPAPPNLADKVLRSIERATRSDQPAVVPISQHAGSRRGGIPSLREFVAIAACLVALIAVAGPGLSQVRARSYRTNCASNLGSIFRGTTLYQQAFGGSLPFAGNAPRAAWLPGAPADRPYQSNSRHVYLVAKLNYGPKPGDFVCPACGDGKPMPADQLSSYGDFANAKNVCYDSLNMCGDRPNLRPPRVIAYMGDHNPLFVNARFNGSIDPSRTNSPAHKFRGQRVLFLDGRVVRLTSPVHGPNRDNLWLAGTIRRYVGTEAPVDRNDAFLIPGFPDTDPLILRRTAK